MAKLDNGLQNGLMHGAGKATGASGVFFGGSSPKAEPVAGFFKKGPLAGREDLIFKSAAAHKISPALLAAVIAQETGFGTSKLLRAKNNPGGVMVPPASMEFQHFGSLEEGVDHVAGILHKKIALGATSLMDIAEGKQGIFAGYCPSHAANDPEGKNIYWSHGVRNIMVAFQNRMGGARRDEMAEALINGPVGPAPGVELAGFAVTGKRHLQAPTSILSFNRARAAGSQVDMGTLLLQLMQLGDLQASAPAPVAQAKGANGADDEMQMVVAVLSGLMGVDIRGGRTQRTVASKGDVFGSSLDSLAPLIGDTSNLKARAKGLNIQATGGDGQDFFNALLFLSAMADAAKAESQQSPVRGPAAVGGTPTASVRPPTGKLPQVSGGGLARAA